MSSAFDLYYNVNAVFPILFLFPFDFIFGKAFFNISCSFLCNDFAIYEFNALLAGSASNPAKLTESQSAIVRKNATSQTTSKTSNAFSESKSGIVQNNATSKPTSKTSYTNASSTPVKGKIIMFKFTTDECFGMSWCLMTFSLVGSVMLTVVFFHVLDWGEEHKTFSLQFGSLSPGFQVCMPSFP